ncbi:LssY C-terminal domain-containing protein [Halieaceae bacterium]|nr:LssY C-terminal domain-containing protein [Halieaceae bacterium]
MTQQKTISPCRAAPHGQALAPPMSRLPRALLVLLLALFAGGCASFEPRELAGWPDPDVIETKSSEQVTVSAAILADEQATALYGVDLASVGLQAIWLRIDNRSDHSHWLLVSALDANYFAPDEAAELFKGMFSDTQERRVTQRFRELAIPLHTSAGEIGEGYVLAPAHEGGRYIEVALSGEQHVVKLGFAIPLGNGQFDFEDMSPAKIYPDLERPDISLPELRSTLVDWVCCTQDESGENEGDPLNLVLVGTGEEVLASLARAGWSFTHRISADSIKRMIGAAISGSTYAVAPISPLYVMGRPQDLAMQRPRSTIFQRNHLRLWLLPFLLEGRSVWIGQVSRDIGIKPSMGSTGFVTHVVDPNVDEAREHLLQSLLVSGTLREFGFVRGVGRTSEAAPARNLSGDPYFTDGLRLFAVLSGTETVPPALVRFLDWNDSMDPMAEALQQ